MQIHFHGRTDEPRGGSAYGRTLGVLAVILAVGGGSAWAASGGHKPKPKPKHHHYLITSTGQIKPSVLSQLHGADGTNGTNGARGRPEPRGRRGR